MPLWLTSLLSVAADLVGWERARDALKNRPEMQEAARKKQDAATRARAEADLQKGNLDGLGDDIAP